MKFSCAVCVCNDDNAQKLALALESISNQSVRPDEIVIYIDGKINEELNKVISDFLFENKRTLGEDIRKGHGYARQKALCACLYDYVAVMDADDISDFKRFESQAALFEIDSTLSVVGGDIAELHEMDSIEHKRIVLQDDENIKKYMKKRCPFNHVTVMMKKSDVMKSGGYLDLFCNEDYYLWVRMALCGCKFANTGTVLCRVVTDDGTYKRRGGIKYFKSEIFLQNFMLKNKIIGILEYIRNVSVRFLSDILITSKMRKKLYNKFLRK